MDIQSTFKLDHRQFICFKSSLFRFLCAFYVFRLFCRMYFNDLSLFDPFLNETFFVFLIFSTKTGKLEEFCIPSFSFLEKCCLQVNTCFVKVCLSVYLEIGDFEFQFNLNDANTFVCRPQCYYELQSKVMAVCIPSLFSIHQLILPLLDK